MSRSGPSVAVIGVGSTGAMAMWHLTARGASVTGFEQYSPGHDRGAHGGETRIFRTAYLESPDYVPLLLRARDLWRRLEDETGARLLTQNGVLTIGSADTEQMANIRASIDTYDLDAEALAPQEARTRFPQHHITDDDSVVLDRGAGFLRPELAVLHASRRAEALGARLRTYTRVTAVLPDTDGVTVRSDAGEERFDHAIVSTGPWARRLLRDLGCGDLVESRRIVQAWFPALDPELFRPDRCPVFVRVTPVPSYGIPAADGSGLKVGLLTEENMVTDPEAFDRTVTVDDLAPFRDMVARLLPELHPEPIRLHAYMDGYTPDGHGLVGPLSGTDRVSLLTGFSGHGFKLAPVLGELAADTVLGATTIDPIAQLSTARALVSA